MEDAPSMDPGGEAPSDDPGWDAVGQAIHDRRVELGLTQQEASASAGVGSTTWRLMEKGQRSSFRPLTLRAIEHTLGWPGGSILGMLDGHPVEPEPTEIELSASGVDLEELRREDPETWDLLMGMARQRLDQLKDRRGQQ